MAGVHGGHHVEYDKNETRKYIVIIRNPVERTISHFIDFNQQNQNKIDNWEIGKSANFQTNWLKDKLHVNNLDEIKDILKEFIVIPTDKLNERMNELGLKAGHFNKNRREYDITEEEREKISKANDLDNELYKWACG